MSDPGTTYRTRDEIQRMRSTQDPIKGLQKYLEDWGVTTEEELKVYVIVLTSECSRRFTIRSPLAYRQASQG